MVKEAAEEKEEEEETSAVVVGVVVNLIAIIFPYERQQNENETI